jgi:hypothetical protein
MHLVLRLMFVGAFAVLPHIAHADLLPCDSKDIASRMTHHFNDAQETRNAPRRARRLDNLTETGIGAGEGAFVPKNYRSRYCEGDLRLDDGSSLHVFIVTVGIPEAPAESSPTIETCWADKRFPRFSEGCSTEMAPSRRK